MKRAAGKPCGLSDFLSIAYSCVRGSGNRSPNIGKEKREEKIQELSMRDNRTWAGQIFESLYPYASRLHKKVPLILPKFWNTARTSPLFAAILVY
jgi:hypothetical protein